MYYTLIMGKPRHEIGLIAGKKYKLQYDQRENVHHCDYRWQKAWRWFLWIDGFYQGDFKLRRDAIKHIENMGVKNVRLEKHG